MLQETDPDLYSYFEMVSSIQKRHEIDVGSSGKYVFGLICCYENDCAHPVCIQGKPEKDICWYPGGPPVNFFLWHVKDPLRPYGQKGCNTCSGFCARHYLKVEEVYKLFKNGETLPKEPPSITVKNEFKNNPLCANNDDNIEILSESTLIPPHETKLHFKHCEVVARKRKLEAAKAAKTRALKRLASSTKKATVGKPNKSQCVTRAKTMDGKFYGRDIQKRKGRQKPQTVAGAFRKIQQHRKSTDKEKKVNPKSSTTDNVPTSPDDSRKVKEMLMRNLLLGHCKVNQRNVNK